MSASSATTLDSDTISTVKGTIPLLVETGPKLTELFYQRMLAANPELKDVFNLSNQRDGSQPRALFNAIALYATNLENVAALLPAVEKIAQKHVSFQVKPVQYDIVGTHLLATIDELYHPGEKVLQAWGKAYTLLARIFINREAEIYEEVATQPGGWSGLREFRIVAKIPRSKSITSFEFEPVDGKPIASYKPGQYFTLWLKPEGFEHRQIRQYSLTRRANGKTYRIAIKREEKGIVSSWMHDKAQVGDVVYAVAPLGDFYMDVEPTTPVTLISGGVGQTPLLAMLDTLSHDSHSGPVAWLHAADNEDMHAFADEVVALGRNLPQFKYRVWYSRPMKQYLDTSAPYGVGHIVLDEQVLSSVPDTEYYVCGPVQFMQNVAKQLTGLGVKSEAIHYEVFGPHKVL